MKSEPQFYGLCPLSTADIDFFLTTPAAEHGAAWLYEFRRQIYARTLSGRRLQSDLKPDALLALKAYWKDNYRRPWPKLPKARKAWLIRAYSKRRDDPCLDWRPARAGDLTIDPNPGNPGSLVTLKIDWDHPDSAILEAFKRSLQRGREMHVAVDGNLAMKRQKMRPRKPLSERREKPAELLRAIAMQRLFDLRGKLSPEKFALEFLADKFPKRKRRYEQLEISLRRIDDGKERYRTIERDTAIHDHGCSTFDDPSLPHPSPREHEGFSLRYSAEAFTAF